MTDTEKIQAIQTGQQFSKYDEWIHSKNPDVRTALALAGQFPHILIRDENDKVRRCVAIAKQDYLIHEFRDPQNGPSMIGAMTHLRYPPKEFLEEAIKAIEENPESRQKDLIPVFQLRLDALNAEPSEESVVDLFLAGNPLWTRGLETIEVCNALDLEKVQPIRKDDLAVLFANTDGSARFIEMCSNYRLGLDIEHKLP